MIASLGASVLVLASSSVLRAAPCYPACLEDLKAGCIPVAPCTRNTVATADGSSSYCFANGVKISSADLSEKRTKPDGSLCYAVDVSIPANSSVVTYMWKNATGALVATESYDGAMNGGRYHTVTCNGTTTTVDMATADCQAEGMQQNPDAEVICKRDAACVFPTAGVGGAGGAGGAGDKGGSSGGGMAGAGGMGGAGALACPGTLVRCGAACVDTQADDANCSACGMACDTAQGYACKAGACQKTDPCPTTGEALCGGVCLNLTTDSKNCGGCGLACDPGQVCVGKVIGGILYPTCTSTCAAGSLMCGIDCKPVNDPRTCGGCDVACGANDVCCSGPLIGTSGSICPDITSTPAAGAPFACRTCPVGTASCDNRCIDVMTSSQHCGNCTTVCEHGCTNGKCNQDPNAGGSCAVGPSEGASTTGSIVGG
ncbi:MAG TPA: hypothetical protein VHU40_03135, partial [Polyangia bacterium]|nr:hypothetical protein [Polyangia bacterium]